MKYRMGALRTTILFHESVRISQRLMKYDTKQASILSVKINMLSDDKKDFICSCVFKLAKFNFRIKFLKWYLKTNINLKN